MQKWNPPTERPPQHRTGLCGVDELRASFTYAIWVVNRVLPRTREVAALHRDANVTIEVASDADSRVGVVYVEVLLEPDPAINRMEVPISAVDVHSGVRIFGRALSRLRAHVRAHAENAGGDCETRNQPLAECEHATNSFRLKTRAAEHGGNSPGNVLEPFWLSVGSSTNLARCRRWCNGCVVAASPKRAVH